MVDEGPAKRSRRRALKAISLQFFPCFLTSVPSNHAVALSELSDTPKFNGNSNS